MKTQGIPYSNVKAKALMNNDVLEAYSVEKTEVEVQILPIKTKNTQKRTFTRSSS
ncbi:hypothetical protein [Thorsellia anophelis]|uniref:hypothetical protein n=1 Tax=Thorsellia anophelis TaxID=336804 RepID=UPI0015A65BF0|nr:hypothetical protein [Thorsellia anophelis]